MPSSSTLAVRMYRTSGSSYLFLLEAFIDTNTTRSQRDQQGLLEVMLMEEEWVMKDESSMVHISPEQW